MGKDQWADRKRDPPLLRLRSRVDHRYALVAISKRKHSNEKALWLHHGLEKTTPERIASEA